MTSDRISEDRFLEAFLFESIKEQTTSMISTNPNKMKPGLTASEACHRLVLIEGQKENKRKTTSFSRKDEIKMNHKTTIKRITICALLLNLLVLSAPTLMSIRTVSASVGQAVFWPNCYIPPPNGPDTENELELTDDTCVYITSMLANRGPQYSCYYSRNATVSNYCSVLSTLKNYYDESTIFTKGHRGMPYWPNTNHLSLLDHDEDPVIDYYHIYSRTSSDNIVTFVWHCETSELYPSTWDAYGWGGLPFCFTHDNGMDEYDDTGDQVYLGWEDGSPQFETTANGMWNYAHVAYYFWYYMCNGDTVEEALDSIADTIFGEDYFTDTILYEKLWAYGNIELDLP